VIPAVFTYVDDAGNWVKRLFERLRRVKPQAADHQQPGR
jgi:hypothetical protein